MREQTRDKENSNTITRRDFIKTGMLAAGGIGVAGSIGASGLDTDKSHL